MASPAVVLVVDDDPRIREIVRFALAKEGFQTAEAEDGAEALRIFDAVRPDALVLDILMPEMDGTEVCRALRLRSRVPILFLSSKDDEVDRILGLELGDDDYITKPFSPRELVARVKAVLRRIVPQEASWGRAAPRARVLSGTGGSSSTSTAAWRGGTHARSSSPRRSSACSALFSTIRERSSPGRS